MDRRAALGRMAALGAAATLGSGAWARQAGVDRPNVLMISIDDLNDWVGCLGGHPQTRTPHLDTLASEGTVFSRAYCPAPSCLPSRAAILTGQAPYRTGVYANHQVWRQALPDAVTLPQHFMANGYFCAGAGKIFHHYQNDPASWHEYFPSKTSQFPFYHTPAEEDRAPLEPWENMYVSFDWGPLDVPDEETGDYQSVRRVSEHLAEARDEPFFLTCGLYRPHVPWYAPRKYFEMFPLDEIELPPMYEHDADDLPPEAQRMVGNIYYRKVMEQGLQAQTVQAYLACIAYTDAMIGRLLEAVEVTGHRDDTIVVLWSDHGWHLGEKEWYRKWTLWEESARVPLIIRDPGGSSVPCARAVNLLDLYPTLSELCGLEDPPPVHGRSLVQLLEEPSREWPYPSITSLNQGAHTVRTERWRYTRYAEGGEELYDHDADPNEWTNLATTPRYYGVLESLRPHLPTDPAPLTETQNAADWIAEGRPGL